MRVYGPAAEKRDLRTYANSEDPDQPVHSRSLVRIFAYRDPVEDMRLLENILTRREAVQICLGLRHSYMP